LLEEVECYPLAGEQRGGAATYRSYLRSFSDLRAVFHNGFELHVRVYRAKNGFRNRKARDDAVFLCNQLCRAGRVVQPEVFRSDVASADVLGERALYRFGVCFGRQAHVPIFTRDVIFFRAAIADR